MFRTSSGAAATLGLFLSTLAFAAPNAVCVDAGFGPGTPCYGLCNAYHKSDCVEDPTQNHCDVIEINFEDTCASAMPGANTGECPNGEPALACDPDPCEGFACPGAVCESNLCGECSRDWYDVNTLTLVPDGECP